MHVHAVSILDGKRVRGAACPRWELAEEVRTRIQEALDALGRGTTAIETCSDSSCSFDAINAVLRGGEGDGLYAQSMSTPTEQARALIAAKALLRDLADDWTPKRAHRARAVLRHYPGPAVLLATFGRGAYPMVDGDAARAMIAEWRAECERRATTVVELGRPVARRKNR